MHIDTNLRLRHVPARQIASIAVAAAIAIAGAMAAASAANTDPGMGVNPDAGTIAKKCASHDYGGGCLAGINSSVGNGVFGRNTGGGFGVEGQSESKYAGVAGYNDGKPGGYGVFARSLHGDALYAYSDTATAIHAESSENGGTTSIPLLLTSYGSTGADVLMGTWGSNVVLEADISGNLSITGQPYSQGSCRYGCSRSRHVKSFGARTSEPTIDDTGEATLHGGSAHVALDSSFANVIDATRPYIVMLTPEGDAGLYVVTRRSGLPIASLRSHSACATSACLSTPTPLRRSDRTTARCRNARR